MKRIALGWLLIVTMVLEAIAMYHQFQAPQAVALNSANVWLAMANVAASVSCLWLWLDRPNHD